MTKQSLVTAVPVAAIGLLVTVISLTYPIGTPARMGPGFLPLACGVLLLAIGAGIAVFDREAVEDMTDAERVRPLLAVFAGIIAWTLTVQHVGLVPATFLLVGLVAFAQRRRDWRGTLATAAVLSIIGVVVFIMGLNIRLDAMGGW